MENNQFFLVYATKKQNAGVSIIYFNEEVEIPEKYQNYPKVDCTDYPFDNKGIIDALKDNDFAEGKLTENFEITFSATRTTVTLAINIAEFAGTMLIINPLKIKGGNDEEIDLYKATRELQAKINSAIQTVIDTTRDSFRGLGLEVENHVIKVEKYLAQERAKGKKEAAEILSKEITEEEKEAVFILSQMGSKLSPRQKAILEGAINEEEIARLSKKFESSFDYEEEVEDEEENDYDDDYCEDCGQDRDDCECDDDF